MIFLYYSINTVNYIGFLTLIQPCIPGTRTAWSRCTILFIRYRISFAKISPKFLHNVHEGCWSVVFFSRGVFGTRVVKAS